MIVLGIESSCDETAIAIINDNKVLSHKIHSQIPIHQTWGGVVPELASRDHAIRIYPLLEEALAEARLSLSEIDAFAYTAGPGLIGSLLIGATAANTLGIRYQKPVYPIHHLEGHILSALIENDEQFPAIVLLVSGGHSMFLVANAPGDYEVIGQSVDDAIGECFDKVAKLMQLGYPGGPIIEQLAVNGDPCRWHLPRPMLHSKDLNMSFSGLKTAVLQTWQKLQQPNAQDKADMAASFQAAVAEVLQKKMLQACKKHPVETVLIVGGVAANKYLQNSQKTMLDKLGRKLLVPKLELCTDNGLMIAKAGILRHKFATKSLASGSILVKPRWNLSDYLADWWGFSPRD